MAKILVVDDAAFMRKVIRVTLTKNGLYQDVHDGGRRKGRSGKIL